MPSPQFIEERSLSLAEVRAHIQQIEERDGELSFLGNKSKEYDDAFISLNPQQQEQLRGKLSGLNLVRLKEEHIAKILDFLPITVNDLKVVLQAYPLSFPKKDQEAIVAVIKEVKDIKEEK